MLTMPMLTCICTVQMAFKSLIWLWVFPVFKYFFCLCVIKLKNGSPWPVRPRAAGCFCSWKINLIPNFSVHMPSINYPGRQPEHARQTVRLGTWITWIPWIAHGWWLEPHVLGTSRRWPAPHCAELHWTRCWWELNQAMTSRSQRCVELPRR